MSSRPTRWIEWWRSRPRRQERRCGQFGSCYVFPLMDPDEVERIMAEPGPFDPERGEVRLP